MSTPRPDLAKSAITQAVILMAGSGSRLRVKNSTILKPLIPIHGRALVSYAIDTLVSFGVQKIIAVVGFEAESLVRNVRSLVPPPVEIEFAVNSQWEKQNGVSLLAAARYVDGPFLLTMSDHVFEPELIESLLLHSDEDKTNVAIDRKLNTIFDLNDAMKVKTRGDEVIAIGKGLSDFDAIDTGLFVCSLATFGYLERSLQNGDCSLVDGIRLMSTENRVRGVDIGPGWWQDIDTPEMLAEAEFKMRSWQHRPDLARAAH